MNIQEQHEQVRPSEKKHWVIPEGDWQRTHMLLLILGIELPLISGLWVWNNDPWGTVMFLSVALGAILLRSWWAVLIVPIFFAIGIALGMLFLPYLQGGWPLLQAQLDSGMVEGMDFLLFLGTPAAIILAAVGAAIGVVFDKGLKRLREN